MPKHQQKIGGVGEIFLGVGEAGLNDAALAGGENFSQQFSVPLLLFLAFVQPRFTEIDLGTEGQPSFFVQRPDGAADGRQRRHDAVQKALVEFFGRNLGAAQLFNFSHQSADLLPRLVDQFGLDRLFGAHRFRLRRPRTEVQVLVAQTQVDRLPANQGENWIARRNHFAAAAQGNSALTESAPNSFYGLPLARVVLVSVA